MCGIIGMISSNTSGFSSNEQEAFEQLIFADQIRGDDSTGAFYVDKDGNVEWLKAASTANDFLKTTDFRKFSQEIFSYGRIAVGHNRKATRGTVSDENAHPFVEKNTILVHNGTIFNQDALATEKVTVDSHAILHGIVENSFQKTLATINGAYALSWYDADTKTLYLARNKERPLFVANTPGCWFFASEKEMLAWILKRNRIVVKDWTDLEPEYIYRFEVDKLETMRISKLPALRKGAPTSNTTTPGTPFRTPAANGAIPLFDRRRTPTSNTEQKPAETPSQSSFPPQVEGGEGQAPRSRSTKAKGGDQSAIIDPQLFRSGHKYTIEVNSASRFSDSNHDYIGYTNGALYFDERVECRIWFGPEHKALLEELLKRPSDVITATLSVRYLNKDKSLKMLHFHKPEKLVSQLDLDGTELFPDDFGLEVPTCIWCKTPIYWNEVPSSSFKVASTDRLTAARQCFCPKCSEILLKQKEQVC